MGIGSGSKNVQIAHNGAAEDEERKRDTETPLASQSLLLLLVLTNHCTAMQNPYRKALFSFIDMQGKLDQFSLYCLVNEALWNLLSCEIYYYIILV